MATTDTPLRQRVRDAGLTPTAVGDALSIRLIDRVLDGPESGQTYDRVIEFLNHCEREGYQAPVAPVDNRTSDERYAAAQAAADEAFLAPRKAAQDVQARLDAYYAADREAILQARAIATAKYISDQMDRISLGMALRDLRETASLGIREVAALIGVEASLLDRLERGKPMGVGVNQAAIEAVYSTLPRFTSMRKVVAK
jgi:hypothetical protein